MMEAASTSETSVKFHQSTRRNIPEDSNLQEILVLYETGRFSTVLKRTHQFRINGYFNKWTETKIYI
jgi:hypothetical protein